MNDDDEDMPRVNAPCNHRRCPRGACRAYTEEAMTPTDADREIARRLIADGWLSTSTKYRSIARINPAYDFAAVDVLRADKLTAEDLRWFTAQWAHRKRWLLRCDAPDSPRVERMTLSFRQFRAFKEAGGECA